MNRTTEQIIEELEVAFLRLAACMEPDGDDGAVVIQLDLAQADAFVATIGMILARHMSEDGNSDGIIRMGLN